MMTDELERDLTRLAEPHDTDDQLRLAIRERLGEQIPASARPRARRTFAFAWAAAGSAAIAAVVVAAGLPGRAAGPSVADAAIVHHALQAVSWPANAIVHVKEVGVQDGTPIAAEWWQQTSAPHALRMIKGQVGQEQEA